MALRTGIGRHAAQAAQRTVHHRIAQLLDQREIAVAVDAAR